MDPVRVALISEVFHGDGAADRLVRSLREARDQGVVLALLPELPLQSWCPATRGARDEDSEPPAGLRHAMLLHAARTAGIAVVGGAIVGEPRIGARHNTAWLVDGTGVERAAYRKVHLPQEPGFWEADHYAPGDGPPAITELHGVQWGLQVCSDANRPTGSLLLGALGAGVIVLPRATEPSTFDSWRIVLRALALTASAYVLSVNRPGPEAGTPLGGPSIAIAPDGSVMVEATERLVLADISPAILSQARSGYPGYLAVPASLYAAWWANVADRPLHGEGA